MMNDLELLQVEQFTVTRLRSSNTSDVTKKIRVRLDFKHHNHYSLIDIGKEMPFREMKLGL